MADVEGLYRIISDPFVTISDIIPVSIGVTSQRRVLQDVLAGLSKSNLSSQQEPKQF